MNVKPKVGLFIGLNPTGDIGGFTIYTSRRAGTVWFIKSPPLTPPSLFQLKQRNIFRLVAKAWRGLTQGQRDDWNEAARTARLYLHGYNLWVWWQTRKDRSTLATIERISGITLL